MKFRKIQRLEFVLDKIEGGDSKSEVVCIRFDHPTKKCAWLMLSMKGQPWPDMGSSPERGKRGKEEGRGGKGGAAGWLGGRGLGGRHRRELRLVPCSVRELLQEENKEEEREKDKKRKGKRKEEKKWENFPNLKISTEKNER
jgi:hypothetical protein